MTTDNRNMRNLPYHYHIEGRVDNQDYGRTPAIPRNIGRDDIKAVAEEHDLPRLSGGAYGDPLMIGNYLVLMPCMRAEEPSYFSVDGWRMFGGDGGGDVEAVA